MNSFEKIRKQRVVVWFLLSYMFILLIPLLIASLSYKGIVKILETNAIEANQSVLEQTRIVLDSRFKEIDSMIAHICMSSKIKALLYSSEPVEKIIWRVKEAQEELSPYTMTNSFIYNFLVYFNSSRVILSPYTSYIRLSNFYGRLFRYDDMSYAEFYDGLLNRYHSRMFFPAKKVSFNGKDKNVITYIHSIPTGFSDNFRANLLFFIDADKITAMLSGLKIGDGGWACIMDSDHKIILDIGKTGQRIDPADLELNKDKGFFIVRTGKGKMIISYTASAYNKWIYVAALPYEIVMTSVINIKRISMIITMLFVLVGILAAYLMASRNSRLLNELVKISSEGTGGPHYTGGNEIDFLQYSIAELVKNNKAMKTVREEQIPLLKVAYLERFLRGELMDKEELQFLATQIGFELATPYYGVLILRVNGYKGLVSKEIIEELNLKKLIIKKIVNGKFPDKVYSHDIGVNEIALLVGLDLPGKSDCIHFLENMTEQLSMTLQNKYKIKISCGAGTICEEKSEVSRSFYEAVEVLDNNFSGIENRLVWYEQIGRHSSVYHYPLDMELQLINLAKAGDRDSIIRLLNTVKEENFDRRKLSAAMIWQLFYEMRGTLVKIIYRFNTDGGSLLQKAVDPVDHSIRGGDPYEVLKVITESYIGICEFINERKKSHNTLLKEEMLDYLNSYYMDSNLCLSMMSMHFDLTEVYTSHFFKEQTGENFSTYLERIRISHAQTLLTDTDLIIAEIAKRTGYNSSHAFRRAYKRVNGIVPTAVRR